MFQTQDLPDSGFTPIRFTINVIPKPQMRSRSKAIPLKNNKTGAPITKNGKQVWTAMNHKAPEQEKHEVQLMQILERYAPEVPWDCAIILGLKVYVPIPDSKPAWWKEAADAGYIRPTGRADYDNYFKFALDVMTQTSFWKDDSQVCGVTDGSGKFYSVKPRWEVELIPAWEPRTKKEWDAFAKAQKAMVQEPAIITTSAASGRYTPIPIQEDLFS